MTKVREGNSVRHKESWVLTMWENGQQRERLKDWHGYEDNGDNNIRIEGLTWI